MKTTKKTRLATAIGGGLTILTTLLLAGGSAQGATPTFCTNVIPAPNGLAASQGKLYATSQLNGLSQNIYSIDCAGGKTTFASLPALSNSPNIFEVYLAVAPGGAGGFPANFLYAIRGNKVFQIDLLGNVVQFADFTAEGVPPTNIHDGITFDHTGAFQGKMIVTFETGGIYTVDHLGNKALLRQLSPQASNVTEGPDVAPSTFTSAANKLLVTQEGVNTIWAVPSGGASQAAVGVPAIVEPESVHFVPSNVCAFTGTQAAFFTTHYNVDSIYYYTLADVSPFIGDALVPRESGGIKAILPNGTVTDFDGVTNVTHEGSTFVDCVIPPPFLDGRMTGGGSVFTSSGIGQAPIDGSIRVTHGFELHCDVADKPNTLEINWDGGNNFHLENLVSASCTDDPNIDSGHPRAPFDTYVGHGTGKLNGVLGATADWTFIDAGEPGSNDTAAITIKDQNNVVVLTVLTNFLNKGNHQAHRDNK